MPERKMLTGNYAAAHGARLARIEVAPVYPITPQTHIMEKLAEFIEKGELDAEFMPVESEHSAMAAAIAAEATGARAFTATSSQGLVYMHENLFVASGIRLPIVMCIVNRALGAPTSILPDLADSLDQRDTGWIQIYVENAQEAHDMIVMAYKIAEDQRVLLPVAVCYEGMIVSHYLEPMALMDQDLVDQFLPSYQPGHAILDPDCPMSLGQLILEDVYYTEYRYQQQEGMKQAKQVIPEVDAAYGRTFGRSYGGLSSVEMMEGAEVALLTLGSAAATARTVVKNLRKKKGLPIGLVKLRSVRPFPDELLRQTLGPLKAVAILERDVSLGAGGIIHTELTRCLYDQGEEVPALVGYISGLGGRDITYAEVEAIALTLFKESRESIRQNPIRWNQVRGLS